MLVIKAYEALVEEKGKNVIYLRLSSRCVSDLQLKDGDKMTCMVIVGTACIVCCRVYVTVQCLSVCLSHLLITAAVCGRFAAVGPTYRRYWSTAARLVLSRNCEQCHVVSWCRKLNTDLLQFEYTDKICMLYFYTDYNLCLFVPSVLWHCWLGVRKSIRSVKIEWWRVGVIICLEHGADCLHTVQLMPLHPKTPIIFCIIWIQTGFTFLVPAYPGCPGKRPLNGCSAKLRQERHPACKNWVVGCWHGYLSGASCRLAYVPTDACHSLSLASVKSRLVFTTRCYASAVLAMALCLSVHLSVCLSVTSWCSTKMAKRRITQTTPHDSQSSPWNSTGVTPYGGAKCRWGGSKSATFDK